MDEIGVEDDILNLINSKEFLEGWDGDQRSKTIKSKGIDAFCADEINLSKHAKKQLQNLHHDISNRAISIAENIYQNWLEREESDSSYRKSLTSTILIAFALQLLITMGIIVCMGIGILEISQEILMVYSAAFIGQMVGVIIIIVKYFYNERSIESLKVLKDLLISTCNNNSKFHSDVLDSESGNKGDS